MGQQVLIGMDVNVPASSASEKITFSVEPYPIVSQLTYLLETMNFLLTC